MSIELFIEYYQQMQEILTNNIFQEYGIIGLFLNSLLAATAIPLPTEILTSALLIGGENIVLVAITLIIGSTIGGILNYFIGFGGNKLIKKIEGTFFPACAPQIPRRRRRILSVSNSERQESIRERETF